MGPKIALLRRQAGRLKISPTPRRVVVCPHKQPRYRLFSPHPDHLRLRDPPPHDARRPPGPDGGLLRLDPDRDDDALKRTRSATRRPILPPFSAKCCSFSAASAPIFARKYAFCVVLQHFSKSLLNYLAEIFGIWQIFAFLRHLQRFC